MEQQFDAGIRYFDFRLGVMNISNLGFYHGFLCTEVSLPKALDNILVDPSKFGPDMRYNDCKGKILLMHMATRKDLLINNFKDASNTPKDRPDTWHLNKTSGYIKYNGKIMSYAFNAKYMNSNAITYIREHLGEKTGWVVMDYARLRTEGAIEKTDVFSDELIKILLQQLRNGKERRTEIRDNSKI